MNNIKHFYYINLDRRSDRKKHIEKEIEKSSILKKNLQRYPAIDGSILDLDSVDRKIATERGISTVRDKKIHHYGITLTYGSLGCAISHYNLYKICAESDDGNMLILEDDIILHDDIDRYLAMAQNSYINYDIFYFGLHRHASIKTIETSEKELYYLDGTFWGCFGYIVTPKVCRFMMDNVFPVSKQFDSVINEKIRQQKITAVGFTYNIIKSGHFGTDNQGKSGLKHKDPNCDAWSEVFLKS